MAVSGLLLNGSHGLRFATPQLVTEANIGSIDWDGELHFLYLHTGRMPAELVIEARKLRKEKRQIQFVNRDGASPWHGDAKILVEGYFEFVSSFGCGVLIELNNWRFNGETEQLSHYSTWRLQNGGFTQLGCRCQVRGLVRPRFMTHKANMLLLDPPLAAVDEMPLGASASWLLEPPLAAVEEPPAVEEEPASVPQLAPPAVEDEPAYVPQAPC